MNIDRVVFLFAGTMISVGLVLSLYVSPYWLLLPGFVGLNMIQASLSGFCPLVIFLKKLGFTSGPAFK
ncbi:MAG: DUF2892 domain-containing protein [Alphaproteobacteria bacterium]|jgi:hypothetical protein|nr:DUF2892 domain-containing protein [Alphaproteobacteria bacterium]